MPASPQALTPAEIVAAGVKRRQSEAEQARNVASEPSADEGRDWDCFLAGLFYLAWAGALVLVIWLGAAFSACYGVFQRLLRP